jgi:acyl-CoA synthetase (AMP-forming)/AMP-acid ligase II
MDMKIVDEHDQEVPGGQPGEIVLRGPQIMTGYWNQPQASAEALRHGWLHTGDVGSVDEDGFLRVLDRLKDMLISGGLNVYSAEVERVLAGCGNWRSAISPTTSGRSISSGSVRRCLAMPAPRS